MQNGHVSDSSTATPATSIVCYGMLEGVPILAAPTNVVLESLELVEGSLSEGGMVERASDGALVGSINKIAQECLSKLMEEPNVQIQFMISSKNVDNASQRKRRVAAHASVILYGPDEAGHDIGVFLDKCGYCLQDPFGCELTLPYKNPHCISTLFDKPQMTTSLLDPRGSQSLPLSLSESLLALQSGEEYDEWEQPKGIKTLLRRHQLQALRFFILREADGNAGQIWRKETSPENRTVYVNLINDSRQSRPPSLWSGGILADEMGLGKTLQMISLIVAAKDLRDQQERSESPFDGNSLASTLVVVPPSLLVVWEDQLKKHVKKGYLSWTRHHSKQRFQPGSSYTHSDIVLTTYQTVQADYKYQARRGHGLFQHKWHRVILDEAHIIRNTRTATSRAVSSLKADSRWAVTGTPIQNGLQDLRGLLSFLQFSPYHFPHHLDEDVFEHMNKDRVEGMRRFKTLFQTILIRRPAAIISLPPRKDELRGVDFSEQERFWYHNLETASSREFSRHMMDTEESESRSWLSALQLINKLRVTCNLGLASRSMAQADLVQENVAQGNKMVENRIATELSLGEATCFECRNIITVPDAMDLQDSRPVAYYSKCQQLFCPGCANLNMNQSVPDCSCSSEAPCALQYFSSTMITRIIDGQTGNLTVEGLSSKILAVIGQIQETLPEKNVVFSFWRTSLDMLACGLTDARIPHVRVDGTLDTAKRHAILDNFRKDDEIKVLLMTISCGGVGLDLTVATRVHLLEPQWNPATEDQALARVHRMGQTKPVVSYRYAMKDSIEECRGKKSQLAELMLRFS